VSLGERPAQEGTGLGPQQVLVVVVGLTRIAFPASVVHSILQPGDLGESLVGATRGRTYPIRTLAEGYGLPHVPDSPETRIILCGRDDDRRGFKVDQVLGMTDVDVRKVRPLPPQFVGAERTWFVGLMFFQDTLALLANPEWLFYNEKADSDLLEGSRLYKTGSDHDRLSVPILELEEATDAENAPWAEI
jgi:hypothetical protein